MWIVVYKWLNYLHRMDNKLIARDDAVVQELDGIVAQDELVELHDHLRNLKISFI